MGRPISNRREKLRYKLVKCPYCPARIPRLIINGPKDMILGPGDTRAGGAHFHKCFVNSMKQGPVVYEPNEERYPADDVREVLKEFGF